MKLNDKFTPVATLNHGAEMAIAEGDVTLGKEYTAVKQDGPGYFYFRDNTGVLVAVHNFKIEA